MTHTAELYGMTHDRWTRLSREDRERLMDRSCLHPALQGLEGFKVQVDNPLPFHRPRRFIVGRSGGWMPVHLLIQRRTQRGSSSIIPTLHDFGRIKVIERVFP